MVRQVQYSDISKKGEGRFDRGKKTFFFTICSVKYLKNEERKNPKKVRCCRHISQPAKISRRRGKRLNPKLAMTRSGFWTGRSFLGNISLIKAYMIINECFSFSIFGNNYLPPSLQDCERHSKDKPFVQQKSPPLCCSFPPS